MNLRSIFSRLWPEAPAWRFPPREFEKKSGMTGIAGHYKMPPGQTAEEIGLYFTKLEQFDDEVNRQILETLKNIIALNPKLKDIPFNDNVYQACRILMGVCSDYNVSDIKNYIYTPRNLSLRAQAIKFLISEKFCLGWTPSPETLEKIKAHFRCPNWEPSERAIAKKIKFLRENNEHLRYEI